MRKRIVLFLILLIVCESRAVPKPMESLTNYNVLLHTVILMPMVFCRDLRRIRRYNLLILQVNI